MEERDPSDEEPAQPRSARPLVLVFHGELLRFRKTEIDRAQLYGRRRFVALDDAGRECETALLTADGKHVLQRGSTANLFLNEAGDAVERCDLVTVDGTGTPRPFCSPKPSEPLEIHGPFPARDLLGHLAVRVHALRPETPAPRLVAALAAGAIFRVADNEPKGPTDAAEFLVGGGDAGLFLIHAESCRFDFVDAEQVVLPEETTDDDDPFAFGDAFGADHAGA